MLSETIQRRLEERFGSPLPEFHQRRIVFWRDEDREFAEGVDSLNLPGVNLVKLTGSNNFAVKKLLSSDDLTSDYLVYDPLSYAKDHHDDWLLDIKLYSEEFRADLLSIRMQELNMPSTSSMRSAMKGYSNFFANKDRVAKLLALGSNYSNVSQLHGDVLAVLAGTKENTPSGVIKMVLLNGFDREGNDAILSIRKFGNEDLLWELVSRYTGFVSSQDSSLIDLAAHLLLTALTVSMKPSALRGLERFISEPHRQLCYDLVNGWLYSDKDDDLYVIAREVEEKLQLVKRFDNLDVEELLSSEVFPCINECILRRYMSEISENVIKADDIVKAVEKRRTLKWYKRVRYYFDGLLQVAQMQQFYQANVAGFHIAEYDKLWKEYCKNYYKMDLFYRQFHTSFGRSLKQSSTVLEDLFKAMADYVEKLYKNWYLSTLGSKWTSLVRDDLMKFSRLPRIANQADFYRNFVTPIVTSGSRAYVVISDALRYEVAVELTDALLKDTKGIAKLSSLQSIFPSTTKFGMAALLPHTHLQLTDDMKVLCDGAPTEGTANRDKILKSVHPGNVALSFKTLVTMKQAERRELIKDAQVVYIYHNAIDAVGDKINTEDQVFDACEQAITEIKNLVRLISNDMNGTNILITSDHGFLYSYQPLHESDKVEKSLVSGHIIELDRRYLITNNDSIVDHMMQLPLSHLNSNLVGFTPLENIRMKKQGGGMNYVHGGISLQETVVPVIEYKNVRSSSKKYVDVKKAEISLISQSRKITNSIFSLDFYQKDAVSGKIASAVYEIYLADLSGQPVSDKKIIVADKVNPNDAERVFRTRFTLKSVDFKKTDAYYVMIVEKNSATIIDRVEFTIDIAFVNDFDF